jgi:hypothetical protein
MPPQTGKSGLSAKLGDRLRKAHEAHKGDETEFSNFGELPAGIENGIAQLVDVKFAEYKTGDLKGQYFFMARGVAKFPEELNGQKVAGLYTQIGPEPLCDTPQRATRKTLDDHLAWVYNELRKLGIDTRTLAVDNLETVAAMLVKAKPHFRFRTWKGKKQLTGPYAGQEPRLNHDWGGLVEVQEDTEPGDGVADHTTSPPPAPKPNGKPPTALGGKPVPTPAPEPKPEPAAEYTDQGDVDSLLERANGGDEDAVAELVRLAVAAGHEESAVEAAESWEAVAEMVKGGSSQQEGGIVVGAVVTYAPMNPKTKKPGKAVRCEVTGVNGDTATLKNLEDGKTQYQKVPNGSLTS